jgi:O-antigen/teichoic acid export membrane protein
MVKNLLGDTLKYGLGKVILKFFSILVVPIIAKNFPPDIFGEINIVTTFTGLFIGIAVLGFDSAAGYYYYQGEEELKQNYLGTSFIIRMFMSVLMFVGFFLFARSLSGAHFLLKNSERYILVILGAAVIPFDNCMSFFVDLTRFLIKPVIYNIANISKVVFYYILIVIFMLSGLTVERIFISMLLSSVVPSVFLFFYYKKLLNFKINYYCLKRMLKYGLPLVPASIMFFFMNSANRFVLNAYTTLEDTGIFSMMNSVASIFLLITSSILIAWPPYSMIIAKRKDAEIIFARVTIILFVLLTPLAFLFWSVSDIVILLFSKPVYLRGENAVILLVIQHILNLLYYCVAIGLTLKEKTIYITIGYSIAAIIAVLVSFPLCKYYGIFGAALSSCIGYLVSTFYVALKSQQFYPVPYKKKFLFVYSSILLVVLSCSLLVPNSSIIINFIIRFTIGCIFLVIPFVVNIISVTDIKNVFSNDKIELAGD